MTSTIVTVLRGEVSNYTHMHSKVNNVFSLHMCLRGARKYISSLALSDKAKYDLENNGDRQ